MNTSQRSRAGARAPQPDPLVIYRDTARSLDLAHGDRLGEFVQEEGPGFTWLSVFASRGPVLATRQNSALFAAVQSPNLWC
ncbi:hypothetical protein V2G26_016124 [Clonostachys chloroleuca]